MFQLLTIYGLTFSSAGLLVLATMPGVQDRIKRYLTKGVAEANEQLAGMFIDVSAQRLILLHAGAPLLGAFIGHGVLGGMVGFLLGLAAGFLIPRGIIKTIIWRRQQRFKAQLVDALLVMSSSLKAGLSLLQAMESLVEESKPPMSQEIGLATKEVRMGLSMDEALKRLKKRMPLEELNLIITAMLVARETGGDVTEVFAKLIETIRERIKVKERIKTLTVIPRIQGWFMAAIPFFFGSFAIKINPNYFEMLFKDPVGNMIGIAAVVCWIMSLFMIFMFGRAPK